jgi:hypothetical protein
MHGSAAEAEERNIAAAGRLIWHKRSILALDSTRQSSNGSSGSRLQQVHPGVGQGGDANNGAQLKFAEPAEAGGDDARRAQGQLSTFEHA